MAKDSSLTKKALANAMASVKMEGYKFSSYHEKLCNDVVTGKISKQDCIKQLLVNTRG